MPIIKIIKDNHRQQKFKLMSFTLFPKKGGGRLKQSILITAVVSART
jgi:hypothetical protein